MKLLFVIFLVLYLGASNLHAKQEPQLMGVNLSGAEYGGKLKEKAKPNINYIWHTEADVKRLAKAGFSVIRVPFLWERFQPVLNGEIVNSEAINLDRLVMAAEKYQIKVLIDPHNFGFYKGKLIGSKQIPGSSFADFWGRLAQRYKRFPNVIFGLMNEPHKHISTHWADLAQAAIYAIRETGAKQLILVPGTRWSGAHSWTKGSIRNPSNADALLNIQDPQNNYAFEMHFYLDKDSSGTHKECVSEDIGIKRLKHATQWLNKHNMKAFLGEFGVGKNELCLKALDSTLKYLKLNSSVWLGWTYWSASKWGGRYMFDIYSLDPVKQPQFNIIRKYLK